MAKADCLFCRIARKEIPSDVVYEDDQVIAIKDIAPAAPVHLLLIPKTHIDSLNETTTEDIELLGKLQLLAAQMARELGVAAKGFRLVNNCGEWGGQAIFHIHYHLLGGKELGWPPE